eukprot:6489657-Amphidinium_carterae.1
MAKLNLQVMALCGGMCAWSLTNSVHQPVSGCSTPYPLVAGQVIVYFNTLTPSSLDHSAPRPGEHVSQIGQCKSKLDRDVVHDNKQHTLTPDSSWVCTLQCAAIYPE